MRSFIAFCCVLFATVLARHPGGGGGGGGGGGSGPPPVRSFDGTGNNQMHPLWGSASTPEARKAPSDYADNVSVPSGANRPSARVISNAVSAHPLWETKSQRLTAMWYAWGQFIDHDIVLTHTDPTAGTMPIAVPVGDPHFDPTSTGTATISFTRSEFEHGVSSPREQVNSISSFIDASMVYGSDNATAISLRNLTGGLMRTSESDLLPLDSNGFFQAGDVRANENPDLTALHTLFMREHNRIARLLLQQHPSWPGERLYQEARRRVIAEIQAITYNEWLPALLGAPLPSYQGYDGSKDPSIRNEFAAAAFRLGHSMVDDVVEFLGDDGNAVSAPLALKDSFFNPQIVLQLGIDPMLKSLMTLPSEEVDTFVVDGLRNFLFGQPGSGGLDLPALNIQRGRDHGLADFNTVRQAYGLSRVSSFAQITSDPGLQATLSSLYGGDVDDVDLWVGGLAEDKEGGGSSVGPTFARIIRSQFDRLRVGDSFWYERDFGGSGELHQLRNTKLTHVVITNTALRNVSGNAFLLGAGSSRRFSAASNHRHSSSGASGHRAQSPQSFGAHRAYPHHQLSSSGSSARHALPWALFVQASIGVAVLAVVVGSVVAVLLALRRRLQASVCKDTDSQELVEHKPNIPAAALGETASTNTGPWDESPADVSVLPLPTPRHSDLAVILESP